MINLKIKIKNSFHQKKKKKKSVKHKHKLNFGNTIGVCKRIRKPQKLKTLDPNTSSLSPLPSDRMLILKKEKEKKSVRHKHKLSLETRLESAREYVGNPKIENPRHKSFLLGCHSHLSQSPSGNGKRSNPAL